MSALIPFLRKWRVIGVCMLIALTAAVVMAQEGDDQSIVDLFTGSFASTRELILFRKTAGPYIVTINGERFVDRAYFEIEATADSEPISADAQVTIHMVPQHNAESRMVSAEIIETPRTYEAVYRDSDGLYVVEMSDIENPGSWMVDISITDAAGTGTTTFTSRIYPRKPDASVWFNIANIAVPITVLLVMLGVYRWRGIRLMSPIEAPVRSASLSASSSI